MHCPRCTSAPLDERDRDGITIDVCASCRGVWLDRGELEKLIARASADFGEQRPRREDYDGPPSSDRPRHGRKRSWLDIFD